MQNTLRIGTRGFPLTLGLSIKNITPFLANFDPPPLSHISDPPFLAGPVQKTLTKSLCTNSLSIVRGVFYPGVCLLSGRFCPGCFLSVFPSVRMHVLQQKVKHHLKFHVSYV